MHLSYTEIIPLPSSLVSWRKKRTPRWSPRTSSYPVTCTSISRRAHPGNKVLILLSKRRNICPRWNRRRTRLKRFRSLWLRPREARLSNSTKMKPSLREKAREILKGPRPPYLRSLPWVIKGPTGRVKKVHKSLHLKSKGQRLRSWTLSRTPTHSALVKISVRLPPLSPGFPQLLANPGFWKSQLNLSIGSSL